MERASTGSDRTINGATYLSVAFASIGSEDGKRVEPFSATKQSSRQSSRPIPVHIVHGRYDRVCHLYQAEALLRALRAAGNNAVNYFITMAGHSSLEPETDSKLCAIMNDLPPMSPFDRGGK